VVAQGVSHGQAASAPRRILAPEEVHRQFGRLAEKRRLGDLVLLQPLQAQGAEANCVKSDQFSEDSGPNPCTTKTAAEAP